MEILITTLKDAILAGFFEVLLDTIYGADVMQYSSPIVKLTDLPSFN